MEARAQATQYRLEAELAGYKTNLIKESIRMGHHELADFFYERGDLQVGLPQGLHACSLRSPAVRRWRAPLEHATHKAILAARFLITIGVSSRDWSAIHPCCVSDRPVREDTCVSQHGCELRVCCTVWRLSAHTEGPECPRAVPALPLFKKSPLRSDDARR